MRPLEAERERPTGTGTDGDVILMGPPGAGKGTQARFIVERNGWAHLATGDLFREHLQRRTELGVLAEGFMKRGAYVPDEVTVGIVRESLAVVASTARVVFDGFPRTLAQAEALDEVLSAAGRLLGRVLVIETTPEEILQRLLDRRRLDDTPDVVRKRLEIYAEQTEPIIARYERRGIVRRVHGFGAPEEVAVRVADALA